MGKTHEALERAEKKHQEKLPGKFLESEKMVVTKRSKQLLNKAVAFKEPKKIPEKMLPIRFQEVKTRLITRFPKGLVKTILITSPARENGCSTAAANFALTLAQDCKLNVLLIDANLRHPSLHEVFDIEYNQGLPQLLMKDEDETSLFKKVGRGNLFVIPCGENRSGPMNLFESDRFSTTLENLRKKFDYIIFDAPPVNGCFDSIMIGRNVDGVILVIESGKTRKQVAIKAKQELEEAGAKIFGVILNRRKHYIPDWIYKRI